MPLFAINTLAAIGNTKTFRNEHRFHECQDRSRHLTVRGACARIAKPVEANRHVPAFCHRPETEDAMTMPWTPEQDDDTLVDEARTNPAAFADLYERYRAAIHNFVLWKVNDLHTAEDITSEVFLRALRGLPTYRSGSFRGWLFQIARNTIVDSQRRERPTTSGDALNGRADPDPGPLELVEVREAREQVHRLVDELTEAQRDIIRLRLHGHTGQEIADALGMTISAVKSAQFRAFEKIRQLMAEQPPEPPDPDHSRFRRPDR
jgi:RNA polymerase sigma-70 factor (ECF subfamily)